MFWRQNQKPSGKLLKWATELMDRKSAHFAERPSCEQRKLDNNHQAQQQLPKRQECGPILTPLSDCKEKSMHRNSTTAVQQVQIPLVKVRWNSKRGPEFTWEREDQLRRNTHTSHQDQQSSQRVLRHHIEVNSCSNECKESYAKPKKLYDAQREQLSDASIEIKAYTQGLKKVEAQLVALQQGQLWYEEKIRFMKIDLDDKTDVLTYHKKLLAEAQKEKEDLKATVEKWHNSSKNLGKLLNTQMSDNDKFGLGYGDHRYDGILSYENEFLQSVFMNKESELEKQPLYDRFVIAGGMHVSQPSESETQTSDFDTCESDCSAETHESLPEPTVNEPKVANEPKVWSDAPIIEEYESDSKDEHVFQPTKEQVQPSFASTNKQVKTPMETVKKQFTHSKNPTVNKKGLGYGFTARACFVCGSFSHLIRDCDFHEKRMAKQAELNNNMRKKSSQREIRPIWNNVQRVNHKNQFVPTSVLTRTGKIPVNTARASGTNNVSTARHDFNRQAVPTNVAMKVNIVKLIVNRVRPANVNTAEVNAVSAVGGKRETAVKPLVDFNGGPVAFGGSKGYIIGKGKIKTGKLDFEDVCFVKELQHFNLFSVSQMCDKKNKVLFTDSECLVLSPEFKLPDENQVLLKIPRQNNMYSFNLENIVPSGGLACLIAKATIDESNKWHRRLGHVNFKNLNKLVKGNLVRGLPSKIFQNDHTCVACQKGKQHKASCKAKSVSSISHSLQLLHMDLFGPTSVRSLNHKTYCLVITDDFSRFSWVFFLRTKDETSGILKDFIRQIENQLNQKVKTIRCDNGTEFKNRDVIELCGSKRIKREYSNTITPQQNGVAERKNKTLIEAARTMLADSFLPNTFWAEAVSTACYVLNRVLVTKPQNKTPYELVTGKIPIISCIRPFGCHVTILNTIDHLSKFEGKSDEGFLVGYSLQSKAFREKDQLGCPQEANQNAGTKDNIDAGDSKKEAESAQDYFVLPIWSSYTSTVKSSKASEEPTKHPDFKQDANDAAEALRKEFAQETEDFLLQAGAAKANIVNTTSTTVNDSEIPALEEIYDNPTDGIFTNSSYDDEGAVANFTNLEPVVNVSPIPTSRINFIHHSTQILGDLQSAVQTRSKVTKSSRGHAFKISEALEDESWVDAMQEELPQFKIKKVWILVDLPYGKKEIGIK
ncbi:putative ribonuclease H-like domain-containing protein [Tanacetum coccineum]|uniref:Ribonuclease H-like domain-containing protein n=1 Tax=Tanacetum coccineum TaxID=301880 RepID=A0ABQ5AHT8_9ASTR